MHCKLTLCSQEIPHQIPLPWAWRDPRRRGKQMGLATGNRINISDAKHTPTSKIGKVQEIASTRAE